MTYRIAFAAALLAATAATAVTSATAQTAVRSAPSAAPAPDAMAPTAQAPGTGASAAPTPGAMAPATASPGGVSLSGPDKIFVQKAAAGGMAEVQAAQLAQQKADDQKVKDFAQAMVTEHTEVNQKLAALAQQKGVEMPTSLDSKSQAEIDKLGKLDGQKFDRAYMKAQVRDHKQMLALLQHEAKAGRDEDLKSFASGTAPAVQKHLDMANSAAAK